MPSDQTRAAANLFGILAEDGTTITLHADAATAWRPELLDVQAWAAIRVSVRRFIRATLVVGDTTEVAIAIDGVVVETVTRVIGGVNPGELTALRAVAQVARRLRDTSAKRSSPATGVHRDLNIAVTDLDAILAEQP